MHLTETTINRKVPLSIIRETEIWETYFAENIIRENNFPVG